MRIKVKDGMPTITSYGKYASSNYGLNTLVIDLDTIRFYYSYETIVAFYTKQTGLVTSVNMWGVTTGKHLHWIQPDKDKRIPYESFKTQLKDAISAHII